MLTIDDLKQQQLILLECISGSKAYGLDTQNSDTDIKGVFYLPKSYYYGLHKDYIPQISNDSNDIVYYELGRFIELLLQNNPNMMELLATPTDKILYKHPIMNVIKPHWFISKLCQKTFVSFANSQIKKAQGLNKKINNPMPKTKKDILDFCVVFEHQKSIHLKDWLNKQGLTQSQIGLTKMPHTNHVYALFVDKQNQYNFLGVIKTPNATDVCLSSVPKGLTPSGHLFFNQMGYSKYCQDYAAYWDWVKYRNDARYHATLAHGHQYDAKNMMHTIRLLQTAYDIATTGDIIVTRANRDELLAIKSGALTYDELITMAHKISTKTDLAFAKSNLPDTPNHMQAIKALIDIRQTLYHHHTP